MKLSIVTVLMFVAGSAYAQSQADTKTKDAQATTVNVNVTSPSAATASPAASATASAPAAPTTGAAAIAVKTDDIKKVRESEEQKNDSKVVEKLEKTRLDDEKAISQKIESTDLKPTVEKVEIVQPAPAPVAAVAPAVPAPAPVATPAPEEKDRKWYAGIGTGNVIYNGNITTKSDFSVVAGSKVDDHLIIEGSLEYTSFTLNNYWGGIMTNGLFGTMNQYDVGATAKYLIFDIKRFKPYVGAGVDYLYRQYTDRIPYGNSWGYNNYTAEQNTNSMNASIVAGLDAMITSRLAIGAQFKYSMPVYEQDNGLVTASYVMQNARPLEYCDFTSWGLTLKFFF